MYLPTMIVVYVVCVIYVVWKEMWKSNQCKKDVGMDVWIYCHVFGGDMFVGIKKSRRLLGRWLQMIRLLR